MARRLSLLAVTVGVLLPIWANAAQKPDARDRVLPNFDIRLQTPRVAPALDADAQKLLGELQRDHPGLRTRPHGNAAGLRAITADGRPLTPAANGTPEQNRPPLPCPLPPSARPGGVGPGLARQDARVPAAAARV